MHSIVKLSIILTTSILLACGGGGGGGSDSSESTPTNSKSFSVNKTWGSGLCENIALKAETLYCAANASLDIYDISQSTPRRIKSIDSTNDLPQSQDIVAVTTKDNLLFVGGSPSTLPYSGWLSIFNIDNPQNPTLVGNLELKHTNSTVYYISHISVHNDKLFLIYKNNGSTLKNKFEIIDISNPASPKLEENNTSFTNSVSEVLGIGNLLYITGSHGLSIVDISDIESPTTIFENPDWHSYDTGLNRLVKQDDLLYYASSEGLLLIDISNIYSPVLIKTIDASFSYEVQVADEKVFLVRYSGINIYKKQTGSYDYLLEASPDIDGIPSVQAKSSKIIIASYNGLISLDKNTYDIKGSVDDAGFASDLSVINDTIFLQHSRDTIKLLDPQLNLLKTITNNGANFHLRGSNVYDFRSDSFKILSLPTGPSLFLTQLAEILYKDLPPISLGINDLELQNNILYYLGDNYQYDSDLEKYITNYVFGSIDISNPFSPRILDHLSITPNEYEFIRTIAINGNYAYIPTYNANSYIIDISNPENMSIAKRFPTTTSPTSINFHEKTMYITGYDEILSWDISNPSDPIHLATYEFNIDYKLRKLIDNKDIQIVDETLYFLDEAGRTCAVAVKDMDNAELNCSDPARGYGNSLIVVSSDEIYLAAGISGKAYKLSYQ